VIGRALTAPVVVPLWFTLATAALALGYAVLAARRVIRRRRERAIAWRVAHVRAEALDLDPRRRGQ
jgi:hypothetical protein